MLCVNADNNSHLLTFTPAVESPINLIWFMSLYCEGKTEYLKKPTQARGDHANYTHKRPALDLNPAPSWSNVSQTSCYPQKCCDVDQEYCLQVWETIKSVCKLLSSEIKRNQTEEHNLKYVALKFTDFINQFNIYYLTGFSAYAIAARIHFKIKLIIGF